MAKMTLLEKAQSLTTGRKSRSSFTAEERELTLAWANDQISQVQVAKTLGMRSSANAYCFLATCMRAIWREHKEKEHNATSVEYKNYSDNFPLNEPRD